MDNIKYTINDISKVDEAISLSLDIFHPTEKEIIKYHNRQDWIQKIENSGLLIVAYVKNELAGFVVCYVKDKDTLHIWVGGVSKKYRGLGLWSGVYKKIEEYSKEKKFQKLTLNTYKNKFPVMYKFAITHGFSCYKAELKDGLEKSFFEKKL